MVHTSRLSPQQAQHIDTDNPSATPARPRPPLTFSPLPRYWRVILYIEAETGTAIALEVDGPMTVGRADLVDGYVPNLDLSPHGARDAGVSRRHAVLFAADGHVQLRDLGSTNGTRLNGFRLEPNQPCKVQTGDRIEFGSLQVTVQSIQPPAP